MDEALGEKTSDEKKRGAGEDLGSDERAVDEIAATGAGGAGSALKGLLGTDAEHAEGGKNSEENGGADGEEDGEDEDSGIDGDGCGAGNRELGVFGETMNGEVGESDAECSAGEGKDEDFGESALEEVGSRGSEGGADGGFAVAMNEAGELRVGEVDARDEKDAEDGSHEEPQTRGGAADEDVFQGLNVGGDGALEWTVELIGWDLMRDVVVYGVDVFGGLGDGDAGF
jgi:hypothetical protein